MKFTAPQLRLLAEAGISRRDFLKYVGKAAAASGLNPLEKLGGLFGKTSKLPVGNTRVKIEFSDTEMSPMSTLSELLGAIQERFGFFKNLVGEVHDKHDYGYYTYESVADVNLNDLVKKWNLEHFGSHKSDEGIWHVDLDYGSIQVIDLKQNAITNDYDQMDDFVGDLVKDPIKDFWEKVGPEMYAHQPNFFDKKGLEELKSRGFNPEEIVNKSKEYHERARQHTREQEDYEIEQQEEQDRLRELGGELDYIQSLDSALGIKD